MVNEEQLKAAELARRIKKDRIFLNNPVVMQGLGLAPLVVAAVSLQNAAMLAVAVLLILTPTRVLAAFLTRFSLFRFRGLTYALSACVVYIGALFILRTLYTPAELGLLGLYLPLLCADPIVLKRYERPQRERVKTAFKKGLITSAGYILVLFLTGGIREFLGTGSLFGHAVMSYSLLPLAALPMGGFILLALLIAAWRGAASIVKRQMALGVKQQA